MKSPWSSIACLAGAVLLAPNAMTQSEEGGGIAAERIDARQVFSGEAQLSSGETVLVDIRILSFGGGLRLEALKLERGRDDVLIVRLRGGSLTTIIGKRFTNPILFMTAT